MDIEEREYLQKKVNNIQASFRLFISDDILERIIMFTNKKAKVTEAEWKNMDQIELLAFLGLLSLSARFSDCNRSIYEIWNNKKKQALKNNPFMFDMYRYTMTEARFTSILKYTTIYDESSSKHQALTSLNVVADIFNKNCKKNNCSYSSNYVITNQTINMNFTNTSNKGKCKVIISSLVDEENFYCSNLVLTDKITESNKSENSRNKLIQFCISNGRNTKVVSQHAAWKYRYRKYDSKRIKDFLNCYLNIALRNGYFIWITTNPDWNSDIIDIKKQKKYLEGLGLSLIIPYIKLNSKHELELDERGLPIILTLSITSRQIPHNQKRGHCFICTIKLNKQYYSTQCSECFHFFCELHCRKLSHRVICDLCST